jgi:hypothetical protein
MLESNRRGFLLTAALLAAAGAGGLTWFLSTTGDSSARTLLGALPPRGGTLIYLDVAAIRKSGFLKLFSGSQAGSESEYRKFVEQTGFDYERDLDALAVETTAEGTYYAAAGDFHWGKLEAYVRANGGTCQERLCRMPASQPGRHISLYEMGGGTLAIAVATDPYAASLIAPRKAGEGVRDPMPPLWLLVPSGVLREGASLPAGTRAFATPLSNADRIEFFVEPQGDGLSLVADVSCRTPEAAVTLGGELQQTTASLNKMLARDNVRPGPRELAAVLASGVFQTDQARMIGRWQLPKEFLEALAGGEVQ